MVRICLSFWHILLGILYHLFFSFFLFRTSPSHWVNSVVPVGILCAAIQWPTSVSYLVYFVPFSELCRDDWYTLLSHLVYFVPFGKLSRHDWYTLLSHLVYFVPFRELCRHDWYTLLSHLVYLVPFGKPSRHSIGIRSCPIWWIRSSQLVYFAAPFLWHTSLFHLVTLSSQSVYFALPFIECGSLCRLTWNCSWEIHIDFRLWTPDATVFLPCLLQRGLINS